MNTKQASILLVDDEPVLREIFEAWLAASAAQVFSARDGIEALDVLAGHKIDLVITDVRMPKMDGITLLKKVKAAGAHSPNVIIMTGFSDITLREAYELGAETVLDKPLERGALLQAMQRSLGDPTEIWRGVPGGADPQASLHMTFARLASALEEERIAFGRRGFCIQTEDDLPLDLVGFKLDFKADQCILAGQGMVRWTAPKEQLAGIEITCLEDASRPRLIELLEQINPVAFIPRSTHKVKIDKNENQAAEHIRGDKIGPPTRAAS